MRKQLVGRLLAEVAATLRLFCVYVFVSPSYLFLIRI